MSKSKYTVTALVPVQLDVIADDLRNAYMKADILIEDSLENNNIRITGTFQNLNILLVEPNIDIEKENE